MHLRTRDIFLVAILLTSFFALGYFYLSKHSQPITLDVTTPPEPRNAEEAALFASLPPDPGEAGKATLAGVDSNNNGVRDDVERWIAFGFFDRPQQLALLQAGRAFQASALQILPDIQQRATVENKALECVISRFPRVQDARQAYGHLGGMMMNTEQRFIADEAWRRRVDQGALPLDFQNNGCE